MGYRNDEVKEKSGHIMTQNDFDYIAPEESDAINRSFEEIRRGECVPFESAEEMAAHFGVSH